MTWTTDPVAYDGEPVGYASRGDEPNLQGLFNPVDWWGGPPLWPANEQPVFDMWTRVLFEPETIARNPPIEDPVLMSGRATLTTGGPVDFIVIRADPSRSHVQTVTPDAAGYWQTEVPPGSYDVTYFKEGCAPIIHGPYTVGGS